MKKVKKLIVAMALVMIAAVALPTGVKADSSRVPNNKGSIGWGAKYSGTVTGDTCDIYKFTVTQSGNIDIIFDGTRNSGYSWNNSYIGLYDASDEKLQSATIEGASRMIHTTLLAGDYTIQVWSDSSHNYNFKATFEGSGETKPESYWAKNDTIIDATGYSVGKRITGNIAQNDACDVYSFKVSKDGYITLNLLNKINAIGYKLESRNGDVSLEQYNIKVGTTKEKIFVTKGNYYLTFKKSGNNYGNYTFSTKFTGMPTVKLKSLKNDKSFWYTGSNRTRKVTVAWGRVTDLSGYEVQYSVSKNFKKGKKTIDAGGYNVTYDLTNMKKNKKYYIRVRGYRTDRNNHRHYTKWSNVKSIKTIR